MADERPLSVSALSRRISDCLAALGPVLVAGELSQVKVAASGHLYATLRDDRNVISLVMWRSQVMRGGPLPREGTEVLVRGSIEVYGPRGSYQLIARSIRPLGAGDLAARFEALKQRLAAEGLFATERKRPLPCLPAAVGIATAAGSAALADLLRGIRDRFPGMAIVHAPCLVQGSGAAASIVRALGRLAQHPDVAVIVVGRGGGSLEDLWAFNEEAVVRAVVACPVPVVSAVGHESDLTLCDLAADLRAKTPTMAGELVVPVAAELRRRVAQLHEELDDSMQSLLAEARERLEALASHRALAGPEHQLQLRVQRLDELQERLEVVTARAIDAAQQQHRTLARQLALLAPTRRLAELRRQLGEDLKRLGQLVRRSGRDAEQRLGAAAARLAALSPLAVLGRGYALLRDGEGRVVGMVAQAEVGQELVARLVDGELGVTVRSISPAGPGV